MRIVLSLFVLAAAAFGNSINIVQNGDFETGDLTGWTTNQQVNEAWRVDGDPPVHTVRRKLRVALAWLRGELAGQTS